MQQWNFLSHHEMESKLEIYAIVCHKSITSAFWHVFVCTQDDIFKHQRLHCFPAHFGSTEKTSGLSGAKSPRSFQNHKIFESIFPAAPSGLGRSFIGVASCLRGFKQWPSEDPWSVWLMTADMNCGSNFLCFSVPRGCDVIRVTFKSLFMITARQESQVVPLSHKVYLS